MNKEPVDKNSAIYKVGAGAAFVIIAILIAIVGSVAYKIIEWILGL